MPGATRTPSYDELAEELHATRCDLAYWRAERLQFAERLLHWLCDGNDQTNVGLALPVDDPRHNQPDVWWLPDAADIAALVRLFDDAETDDSVAAAERQSSRDR